MKNCTTVGDAVAQYVHKDTARFHMPGHKGRSLAYPQDWGNVAAYDLTEIAGLDSLYSCNGILRELEKMLAAYYHAGDSLLSAGGATLCNQAMLGTFCSAGGKLVAARGLHQSVLSAMALLDLHPQWIYPSQAGLFMHSITPQMLDKVLAQDEDLQAVFITSPDYWGHIGDVEALAAVCEKYHKPLLVDNAHGAHFPMIGVPHPMVQGAAACTDSLHKTTPALTGAAVLHLRSNAHYAKAKAAMGLFGSTSPSYLIMQSAESALCWCNGPQGRAAAAYALQRMHALTSLAESRGFRLPPAPRDPLRLCLDYSGISTETMLTLLEKYKLMPEYIHGGICLFMASVCTREQDFMQLEGFLQTLPAPQYTQTPPAFLPVCPSVKSLRQGLFSPKETVEIGKAAGRIAAQIYAPCPPGIPIAAPGELVTAQAAAGLLQYGIGHIDVVMEGAG